MSLNRVMVMGRLGADPELRYSDGGRAVASFSVGTSEVYADRQGEKRSTAVEWHRVVVFGKLAETCNQYLHKGRQVLVEGRLRSRSFEITGGDGRKGKRTEIVAIRVQFLGRGGAPAKEPDAESSEIAE